MSRHTSDDEGEDNRQPSVLSSQQAPVSGKKMCQGYYKLLRDEYPELKLRLLDLCPGCHVTLSFHPYAPPEAGARPSSNVSGADSMNADKRMKFSERITRIGSEYPKWKKDTLCKPWLDSLTIELKNSEVPELFWPKVFTKLVKDPTGNDQQWIQSHIVDANLSWKQACDSFTAHFEMTDTETSLLIQWKGLKHKKGQPVQWYADKFLKLASQLSMDTEHLMVKDKFLSGLDDSIRKKYESKLVDKRIDNDDTSFQFGSLSTIIKVCENIDVGERKLAAATSVAVQSNASSSSQNSNHKSSNKNDRVTSSDNKNKFVKHKDQSVGSTPSSSSEKRQSSGGSDGKLVKKERKCFECGGLNHIAKFCRANKSQQSHGSNRSSTGAATPSSSSAPASSSGDTSRYPARDRKPVDRFDPSKADGSKKDGKAGVHVKTMALMTGDMQGAQPTPAPESKSTESASVNAAFVLDRVLDESVFFPSTRRYQVMLVVSRRPLYCLLDTGATHCFIDADVARSLSITVDPIEGPVQLAHGKTRVNRIGVTEMLDVSAVFPDPEETRPIQEFRYSFQVLELGSRSYSVILGMDVINRLFPTGIPPNYYPDTPTVSSFEPAVKSVSVEAQVVIAGLPVSDQVWHDTGDFFVSVDHNTLSSPIGVEKSVGIECIHVWNHMPTQTQVYLSLSCQRDLPQTDAMDEIPSRIDTQVSNSMYSTSLACYSVEGMGMESVDSSPAMAGVNSSLSLVGSSKGNVEAQQVGVEHDMIDLSMEMCSTHQCDAADIQFVYIYHVTPHGSRGEAGYGFPTHGSIPKRDGLVQYTYSPSTKMSSTHPHDAADIQFVYIYHVSGHRSRDQADAEFSTHNFVPTRDGLVHYWYTPTPQLVFPHQYESNGMSDVMVQHVIPCTYTRPCELDSSWIVLDSIPTRLILVHSRCYRNDIWITSPSDTRSDGMLVDKEKCVYVHHSGPRRYRMSYGHFPNSAYLAAGTIVQETSMGMVLVYVFDHYAPTDHEKVSGSMRSQELVKNGHVTLKKAWTEKIPLSDRYFLPGIISGRSSIGMDPTPVRYCPVVGDVGTANGMLRSHVFVKSYMSAGTCRKTYLFHDTTFRSCESISQEREEIFTPFFRHVRSDGPREAWAKNREGEIIFGPFDRKFSWSKNVVWKHASLVHVFDRSWAIRVGRTPEGSQKFDNHYDTVWDPLDSYVIQYCRKLVSASLKGDMRVHMVHVMPARHVLSEILIRFRKFNVGHAHQVSIFDVLAYQSRSSTPSSYLYTGWVPKLMVRIFSTYGTWVHIFIEILVSDTKTRLQEQEGVYVTHLSAWGRISSSFYHTSISCWMGWRQILTVWRVGILPPDLVRKRIASGWNVFRQRSYDPFQSLFMYGPLQYRFEYDITVTWVSWRQFRDVSRESFLPPRLVQIRITHGSGMVRQSCCDLFRSLLPILGVVCRVYGVYASAREHRHGCRLAVYCSYTHATVSDTCFWLSLTRLCMNSYGLTIHAIVSFTELYPGSGWAVLGASSCYTGSLGACTVAPIMMQLRFRHEFSVHKHVSYALFQLLFGGSGGTGRPVGDRYLGCQSQTEFGPALAGYMCRKSCTETQLLGTNCGVPEHVEEGASRVIAVRSEELLGSSRGPAVHTDMPLVRLVLPASRRSAELLQTLNEDTVSSSSESLLSGRTELRVCPRPVGGGRVADRCGDLAVVSSLDGSHVALRVTSSCERDELDAMPKALNVSQLMPKPIGAVRVAELAPSGSTGGSVETNAWCHIDPLSGSGYIPEMEAPKRISVTTTPELEPMYAPERERMLHHPRLKALMEANARITGFCNDPLSVIHLEVHPDKLKTLWRPQYRIPERCHDAVDEAVAKWLERGKIELAPPGCPYNNALLAVPKKDEHGNWTGTRVCMDLRALNAALMNTDRFPLPRIRESFDALEGRHVYAELDMEDAYPQMLVHEDSRQFLAFTWRGVQYRFVGAPFGGEFFGNHFQRHMGRNFGDLPFTFAYMDNLPVASNSFAQHLEHLIVIFERANRLNMKVKPASIKICYPQIRCLGRLLSVHGLGPDPKKLESVPDLVEPQTSEAMQSFLGYTGYLREFVRHFSELAAPLEAVKNNKVIEWTDEMRHSFKTIKHAILHAPFLQFPDFSKRFCIATDASNYGVGGVLYQPDEDGKLDITPRNIVAVFSYKLSKCQRNYSAYKKELFGIVKCLREFHAYIWGRTDTIVFTDHKPLVYMFKSKELSYALQQYLDVILDYSFHIEHRPGILNVLPDALSRLYYDMYANAPAWGIPSNITGLEALIDKYGTDAEEVVKLRAAAGSAPRRSQRLAAAAQSSDGVEPVQVGEGDAHASSIESATESEPDDDPGEDPDRDATLLVEMEKRGKTCPATKEERRALIEKEHAFGHFGREAIFKKLWSKGIWWLSIRKDIEEVLVNCDPCLRYNVTKAGYNPASYITAVGPWCHVQIDCHVHLPESGEGFAVLLAIICVFTGFIILRPVKSTTAEAIAKELWEVFCIFGPPQILQSDNGPEFVNDIVRALTRLTGIDHRFISPYNPRADGKVERSIGTVMNIIKKMLHGSEKLWPCFVPFAQLAFNNKVSELTGSSPFALMFGRAMNEFKDYTDVSGSEPVTITPDDRKTWTDWQGKVQSVVYPGVLDRTINRKEKMVQNLNKQRKQLLHGGYPNGAIVMLRDPVRKSKMDPPNVGPYTIVRRTRNGNYLLKDATGAYLERHVPPDQLRLVTNKPRPVDLEDNTYEVERILSHRGGPGKYEYYVKWKDHNARTWEPETSFLDDQVIKNYWKQVDEEQGEKKQSDSTAKRTRYRRRK